MKDKFKQTDIGLIPEDWDVNKIKDVFSFTKKPRSLEIDSVSEVPFIPMELIPDNKIYVEEFELKRFDSFSSGTYFENGDILLAKITPSFENGKQAIANIPYDFGYATTEVIPINELKDVSSKYFLFNYLLKSDVRKTLAGKMEGSTGRQRLPKTVLQNTLIPLPPLPEQKKIAHVLSKIQQAIETQEQIIKTTQELKKALMQKLFTEGLNGEPQKQTEIGLIPESWEVVIANEYFDRVTDGTHDSPKKLQEGFPLVTSKCLKNGEVKLDVVDYFISEEDFYEVNRRSKVDSNDILFSMIGTIGEVARIIEDPNYAIKNVGLFKTTSELKSEFAFYWFQTEGSRNYIRNNSSGSTQKYIPLIKLRGYPIAKPKDKESQKIVSIIRRNGDKLNLETNKLKDLKELFQASLNKLMTGQIRVKDIEFLDSENLNEK